VPETGAIKKPRPRGGVFRIDFQAKMLSRASTRSPRLGSFFRFREGAHVRDHHGMMIVGSSTVNNTDDVATPVKKRPRKKAGLERARLEVLAT
jgi:hypothetical protein